MSCQSCKEYVYKIHSDTFKGQLVVKNKKIIRASSNFNEWRGQTLSQFEKWASAQPNYEIIRVS